jgi:hypothetical protein
MENAELTAFWSIWSDENSNQLSDTLLSSSSRSIDHKWKCNFFSNTKRKFLTFLLMKNSVWKVVILQWIPMHLLDYLQKIDLTVFFREKYFRQMIFWYFLILYYWLVVEATMQKIQIGRWDSEQFGAISVRLKALFSPDIVSESRSIIFSLILRIVCIGNSRK